MPTIQHSHPDPMPCPQNCPGRTINREDPAHTHAFATPAHFTCEHPEHAKNCVTETASGTETHAHMCDDCVATRSLRVIAEEIRASWENVSPHAEPYLEAMGELDDVDDYFFYDDGKGIVLRFLGNATTWRGEHARRIKAELKQLVA